MHIRYYTEVFNPLTLKFQHTIYVKWIFYEPKKKGNIVKYTTLCRGINGDCASKSKKIIQYIVD